MELVVKGKRILIIMITILLLFDISTTVVTSYLYARYGYSTQALSGIITGIIRFAITALILFFLYRGHKWAKWLIVILMFFAGIFSVLALSSVLAKVLGLLFVAFGITLIASRSINEFLKYQRNKKDGDDYDHNHDTDKM